MPKNILLIEDHLPFSPSVQEQIESLGHSVVVCPNAKASVGRFLPAQYDVVVINLSLSSSALEGMAVIQSMKSVRLEMPPIVIASGHDTSLIAWAASKVETSYWIQKPCSCEKLASIIERAVDDTALDELAA